MTTTHKPTQAQLDCIDSLTNGLSFEQLAEAYSLLDETRPNDHTSFTADDANRLIDHLMDLKGASA